jgi:hypothetical protein
MDKIIKNTRNTVVIFFNKRKGTLQFFCHYYPYLFFKKYFVYLRHRVKA